jgi:hypothetical protein
LAHPLVYHQVLFCHVDSGCLFHSFYFVFNPDHTPTSAQSQDKRPTDAPNPENRPKRSNGNEGQKQNRTNGKDNPSQQFGVPVGLLSWLCAAVGVWSGFDPSIGLSSGFVLPC